MKIPDAFVQKAIASPMQRAFFGFLGKRPVYAPSNRLTRGGVFSV